MEDKKKVIIVGVAGHVGISMMDLVHAEMTMRKPNFDFVVTEDINKADEYNGTMAELTKDVIEKHRVELKSYANELIMPISGKEARRARREKERKNKKRR